MIIFEDDIDIENEGLLQKVEVIDLPNLSDSDLEKIQVLQVLRDEILIVDHQKTQKIEEEIAEFVQKLEENFDEHEIAQCAYYHIARGVPLVPEITFLDFHDSHSIEAFLFEIREKYA